MEILRKEETATDEMYTKTKKINTKIGMATKGVNKQVKNCLIELKYIHPNDIMIPIACFHTFLWRIDVLAQMVQLLQKWRATKDVSWNLPTVQQIFRINDKPRKWPYKYYALYGATSAELKGHESCATKITHSTT